MRRIVRRLPAPPASDVEHDSLIQESRGQVGTEFRQKPRGPVVFVLDAVPCGAVADVWSHQLLAAESLRECEDDGHRTVKPRWFRRRSEWTGHVRVLFY